MLDLAIGTKFYFENDLIEVVEGDCKDHDMCSKCIFIDKKEYGDDEQDYCFNFECMSCDRKDKKDVYFKKIEE